MLVTDFERPAVRAGWRPPQEAKVRRRIMLVDANECLVSALACCFNERGYQVVIENNGAQALKTMMVERPDLIIMEPLIRGFPDGLEVFRTLRANTSVPITVFSERSDPFDQVIGLEMGADHYLAKPLEPRVVLAHVEALFRRSERESKAARSAGALKVGPFAINRLTRSAAYHGRAIALTLSEFELFWVLLNNYGNVVERQQLVRLLKLTDVGTVGRSLDGRAFRLRRKLEDAGAPAGAIKAMRNRGLILVADESPELR